MAQSNKKQSVNNIVGEDCFITRLNVLQQDFNVVVSVRAGLFMVEAQSMEQFMLDGAMVKASTLGQRHYLLTTTTADEGPAAGWDERQSK